MSARQKPTGLCHDCSTPIAVGVRCTEHAEAHALVQRDAWRAQKRAANARRAAAGLCLDCPLPAVVGHRRCNKHMAKARAWVAARYRGRPGYVPRVIVDDSIDDLSGDRCRCGLRLPCHDCTSVVKEVERRRCVW